jgi:hypothetical protein
MFGRLSHKIVATAALSGVVMGCWARSGYLPNGGPLPLRFRAAPVLSTNGFSPLPPASVEIGQAPEEENDDLDDIQTGNSPQAGTNAETFEASSAPPPVRPPSDPVVSPQMLMQYFPSSTNSAPSVLEPVGFVPPMQAGLPAFGPKRAP